MSLTSDRLERFARHIVLPELGGAGQVALAGKHLVLVGLGGIGSPALQYLAASGIGRLTLVDDDKVDVSNLQRQTLYNLRAVPNGKAHINIGVLITKRAQKGRNDVLGSGHYREFK